MEKHVRERLQGLQLSESEREDIIAEITAHLELIAEEYRSVGLDDKAACSQALLHFGNTARLLREIQRAKESGMNNRFRRLWLPGVVVGFLAYASQMVILRFVSWPRSVHVFGNYYSYTWQWIVAVVLIGALGAWWSRQVGGSVRERLVVALASAEIMAAVIAIVLPLNCVIQACVDQSIPYAIRHPIILLTGILWMLYCAVPAFIGAMPFLFGSSVKESEAIS